MKNINNITEAMRKIFVSTDVFNLRMTPIERIVYGFVSLALTAIVGMILFLVIKQPTV